MGLHADSESVLWNLGHEVGRTTAANILQDHGIERAQERGKHMTWGQLHSVSSS